MNDPRFANSPRATAKDTERIRTTPGVCGGEACIRDTRISVRGLVEWRNEGLSDSEILERIDGLVQTDLDAAWQFYRDHTAEIDEAIRRDREA